jgi:hypothetical protein
MFHPRHPFSPRRSLCLPWKTATRKKKRILHIFTTQHVSNEKLVLYIQSKDTSTGFQEGLRHARYPVHLVLVRMVKAGLWLRLLGWATQLWLWECTA